MVAGAVAEFHLHVGKIRALWLLMRSSSSNEDFSYVRKSKIYVMVPTRNFEAHGTSKRTELRSTRNFETHGTSKMSSKLLCILLYLNLYYSSYLTP